MGAKLACAIWPWGTKTKEQFIEAVKDISDVGFRYYESVMKAMVVFADDPDEQWRIASEYGVEPTGFYVHLTKDPAADIVAAQNAFKLFSRHGIKVITLQTASVKGGHPTKEQLEGTLDTIQKFGELGREYGIKPCLHPHVNTTVTFEPEIDYVMERTDPDLIFMAPDTAHLRAAGCDPLEIMTRYASRIRFLHLKDLKDATASAVGYEAGVEVYDNFVELGKGDIDFAAVRKLLKDIKYDGFYTAELDISRTSNKESAIHNYNYMKEMFGGE